MTSYTTFEVKHATQSLIFILCMNAHMQSILVFLQVCVQDDMEKMNAKDKCRYINLEALLGIFCANWECEFTKKKLLGVRP